MSLNEIDDSEEYLIYRVIVKYSSCKKPINKRFLLDLFEDVDIFDFFVNEENKWAILTFLTEQEAENFIESYDKKFPYFFVEYATKRTATMNEFQKKKLLLSQKEDLEKYKTMKMQFKNAEYDQKSCLSKRQANVAEFISECNGEFSESQYNTSLYRNYCESYMVSLLPRIYDPEHIVTSAAVNKNNHSTIEFPDNHSLRKPSHEFNKENINNTKIHTSTKHERFQNLRTERKTNLNSNTPNEIVKDDESPLKKNTCSTEKRSNNVIKVNNKESILKQNGCAANKITTPQIQEVTLNWINKTVELPKNVFTKVTCQVVISYHEGWITLLEKENIVNDIAVALNSTPLNNPATPSKGLLCAAKYDGVWCRAVVTNVNPLKVHYIDYGNDEELKDGPINDLLQCIDKRLTQIPAQAIHISLAPESSVSLNQGVDISIKPIDIRNGVVLVQTATDEVQQPSNIPPKISSTIPIELTASPVKTISPPKKQLPNKIEKTHVLPTLIPADVPFKANKYTSSPENPNLKPNRQRKSLAELLKTKCEGIVVVKTMVNSNDCTVVLRNIKEYSNELETIDEMWRKYPTHPEKSSVLPNEMVAVEYEDAWYRGIVINKEKESWNVGLIDLGITVSVKYIFPLLNEHLYLPEFSCYCKITEKLVEEETFNETFQENKTFGFQITAAEDSCIMGKFLNRKNKKILCKVLLSRWIPRVQNELLENEDINIPSTALTSGMAVKIAFIESQNSVFVANRNSRTQLNQIDIFIDNMSEFRDKNTFKPQQYCLAKSTDGQFYRGFIELIKNDKAQILFIDYGNVELLPIKYLKKIPEELTQIPIVLNKVELKNIPLEPKNNDFIQVLEDLHQKGTKCKLVFDDIKLGVTLENDDQVSVNNLFFKNKEHEIRKPVQVKVQSVEKEVYGNTNKINSTSVEKCNENLEISPLDISLGLQKVLFQCVVNAESRAIACSIPDFDKLEYLSTVLPRKIENHVSSLKQTSFCPPEQTFCLAKYEGEWFRAVSIAVISDKEVEVLFVDFGNMENVSTQEIRPICAEFLDPPCMSTVFIIEDVPDNITNEEFTSLFVDTSLYDIEVLSNEGFGMYNAKMPHVVEKLKSRH